MSNYPPLTPEEAAKRLRLAEIRQDIAKLVKLRIRVKAIYRMNHNSDEFTAAKAAFRANVGIPSSYDDMPDRWHMKHAITSMHVESAALRGKVHGPQNKAANTPALAR